MAETATPSATPAPSGTTPSEPGSGTAPASPQTPTPAPKPVPASADQARRQSREGILNRLREADEAKQETEPTPAAEPGAEATPAATTDGTPGGAAPAEGEEGGEPQTPGVKVELSADHPMANGKAGTITVATEEEARVVRGLINSTGVRVRELTGLRGRAQEAERRAMEAEQKLARLETTIDVKRKWEGTPEHAQIMERYRSIKEEHGQAEADAYLRGKTSEVEQQVNEQYQTREQEIRAQADARAAEDWTRETYLRLESLPAFLREQPQFSNWFQAAMRQFEGMAIAGEIVDDAGQRVQPGDTETLHRAFRNHFEAYLLSRPEVRKAYAEAKARQAQQEQAATDKAAAEEERINQLVAEKVAEALKRSGRSVPPNPLGQIPSAARAMDPSGPGAEVPAASASPGSADQVRRAARDRAMGNIRTRYGGGT